MPSPAIYPLRNFQVGVEATPGTPVPATWKMVGDAVLTPKRDRYYSDYPRGVRMAVTDGGVPLMAGALITCVSELTYEELLYPVNCGLATAVITGTSPKVHTATPILTGAPAIKTFTGEWEMSDGSGHFVRAQAPYGFCTGFDVEWAANQIAKLTARYEFRAPTYGHTLTPALTPMTGRERVSSNLFGCWMDDTWAGLGGTQLVGTIRSGKLTVNTGITSDYTTDARTDYSFTQLKWGDPVSAALSLVGEMNSTTDAEITNWLAQDAGGAGEKSRFFRLKATSPNAVAKYVQLDGSFIYDKEPAFSQQGKAELVTLSLRTEYDGTSAKGLLATIANSIATFT